jgi:hypothetical protein
MGKPLEFYFRVGQQITGLILQPDDITNFEDFGIYFQHSTHSDCVLFSPFSCEEFAEPRSGSDRRKKKMFSEMWKSCAAVAREESTANYAEVRFNITLLPGPSHLVDGFDGCTA